MNIKIDLFDKKVAKDVDIAIIDFVNIAIIAIIVFDVNSTNSL